MSWWLLPAAIAVVVLGGLSVFLCVRRPPEPLWPVAFLCQVAALLWVLGDLLTFFAGDVVEKQLALALLFTGSLSLPALWWVTAVRYVRSHRLPWSWLHSRWAMLPAGVGAVGWLAMITNPWHGRFVTPVVGARSEYHVLAHVIFPFALALIPAASALFLALALARQDVSRDVRRSARILAFSAFAPLAATSAYMFSGWQIPIDPVCIGLSVACAAMIWGVYHTGLFSLLPVALPEVLRHDPNGVLLLGPGGRLLHWNPAAERILAGVPLEPGLDFFRALLPELRSAAGDPLETADPHRLAETLCRAPRSSGDHVYRLAGGERYVRIGVSPVPTRRGRLAALALRIEDVTRLQRLSQERRELEAELLHAEKLKSLGLLAGGIAHDFNNLLGTILGNASLAIEGPLPGPDLQDQLGQIEEAAKQAADLTMQLLTYGGNAPASPARLDLSRLVGEMARLLEVSVAGRATLRTELAEGATSVVADPGQLRQLVLNLVTNAAEAVEQTGADGHVTLRTRCVEVPDPAALPLACDWLEPGRHVVLEVADTGVGMSEEVRSRIFDPFFTTRRDGRGLGMAVVFGCVRALRGGIEIQSQPDAGTLLRVYLPEARPAELPEPAPAPAARARVRESSWLGGGRVLVVDDQPGMLRALSAMLRQSGFEVIEAGSGREAIEAFRAGAGAFRLVLLDLALPDVGGEEVLRELRRIDPEVRVVLTSGFAESQVMARLGSGKLAAFLQKPFERRELLETLRGVLESRTPARPT